MCQQNGSFVGTYTKREPIGIILPQIDRYNTHQWWDRNNDAFIWKEVNLRVKYVKDTSEVIFYSEISNDEYEIFWVKFLEELFHWINRLQEASKFQERVKKTCSWNTK
jgi:hypothetical protein